MSITDNYVPLRQLGNGSTTVFSGLWAVLAASYVLVYLESVSTGVQTLQVLGSDYTITFDNSGFTVTFNSAPTNANYVVIGRDVGRDQTNPYRTSKGFQGEVVEGSFDKLTAMAQDTADAVGRTLTFKLGSSLGGTLPTPVDDEVLAWNGTGGNIKSGPTTASLIAGAAAAAASASAASSSATSASTSATAAAASAATAAAVVAAGLIGTSSTAITIGSGAHTFTTQSGKTFTPGNYVMITSNANPTVNFMNAQITSYSGTSLIVSAVAIGGSGSHSDWTINISGVQGATGPQGAPGAGTGDMLGANNLSDVANAATARTNLGLGTAAVQAAGFFAEVANNLSDVANAATAFSNIKQAGTSGATGVLQLATNAEAITGTDTAKATTCAGVSAAIAAAVTSSLMTPGGVGSLGMAYINGDTTGTTFANNSNYTAAGSVGNGFSGTWKCLCHMVGSVGGWGGSDTFSIFIFQRVS